MRIAASPAHISAPSDFASALNGERSLRQTGLYAEPMPHHRAGASAGSGAGAGAEGAQGWSGVSALRGGWGTSKREQRLAEPWEVLGEFKFEFGCSYGCPQGWSWPTGRMRLAYWRSCSRSRSSSRPPPPPPPPPPQQDRGRPRQARAQRWRSRPLPPRLASYSQGQTLGQTLQSGHPRQHRPRQQQQEKAVRRAEAKGTGRQRAEAAEAAAGGSTVGGIAVGEERAAVCITAHVNACEDAVEAGAPSAGGMGWEREGGRCEGGGETAGPAENACAARDGGRDATVGSGAGTSMGKAGSRQAEGEGEEREGLADGGEGRRQQGREAEAGRGSSFRGVGGGSSLGVKGEEWAAWGRGRGGGKEEETEKRGDGEERSR